MWLFSACLSLECFWGVLLDVRTSVVVCVDKLPMVREWEWRGCIAWPM